MGISPINLFENQLQAMQIQKLQDSQGSSDNKVQAETYNVRTAYADDPGDHNWKNRCGEVLKMIDGDVKTNHGTPLGKSDFVSIQEAEEPQQWQYLVDQMKDRGYSYVPQGEQGSSNGNILFYKADTWNLEDSGQFGIKSDEWQRSAIWGHFENKNTGQEMYSFASHFPRHTGITSLENISENIDKITNNNRNVPVLFMADTNDKAYDSKGRPSYDDDPAFQNLGLDDTYDKVKPDGRDSTDHAWDGVPSHREDMIFARGVDWGGSSENSTHILRYEYTDPITGQVTTPSDHYAVVSDLYFKPSSRESAYNVSGLGNIAELQKEMDEVSKNSMDDHPCSKGSAILFGGEF